jgi:hypothetical protein
VERNDGGRGFGFTGGHFYKNWWSPDFRKLILNAIAWTAKAEVPKDGIASKLEDRMKVLINVDNATKLAFAVEQDPRLIAHLTPPSGTSVLGYALLVDGQSQIGVPYIQRREGEAPDALRRRCAAALGLSPLSFDPPTNLVQFAIPRDGAQWQPQAR